MGNEADAVEGAGDGLHVRVAEMRGLLKNLVGLFDIEGDAVTEAIDGLQHTQGVRHDRLRVFILDDELTVFIARENIKLLEILPREDTVFLVTDELIA